MIFSPLSSIVLIVDIKPEGNTLILSPCLKTPPSTRPALQSVVLYSSHIFDPCGHLFHHPWDASLDVQMLYAQRCYL